MNEFARHSSHKAGDKLFSSSEGFRGSDKDGL